MTRRKQKNDLLLALNHIERFHRRRMVLIAHAVISLGLFFAVWANWYSSYVPRRIEFTGTFFTDRLTISVVIALFLIGHYVITRLAEAKDILVVKAIQQFDAEEDIIESSHHRLMDESQDDDLDSTAESNISARAYRDQNTGV